MSLTIEKPETEARLLRWATARGLSALEAIDELLDEAEEEEGSPLATLPSSLMYPAADALKKAMDELDAGKGISGAEFIAELRRPLD